MQNLKEKKELNLCSDFKRYVKYLEHSEYLAQVDSYYKRYNKELDGYKHIDGLLELISKKNAFSLIRLGDGEGNILFWGKYHKEYELLACDNRRKIFNLMFGNKKYMESDYEEMHNQMYKAILNSDIIGLPTFKQVNDIWKKVNTSECKELDLRGNTGYLALWDILLDEIDKLKCEHIVNSHFHINIAKELDKLLNNQIKLSVITCYPELLDLFVQKFDVKKGLNLNIPPQAVNIGNTPNENHFSSVYNKILETINNTDIKGSLFLVGAGILGKIYCSAIKNAGGMAIDVGSMMDVWVGKSVRGYQNDEFVQKYKL